MLIMSLTPKSALLLSYRYLYPKSTYYPYHLYTILLYSFNLYKNNKLS